MNQPRLRKLRASTWTLAAAGVGITVGVSGIAYATVPGGDNQITGCYATKNGAVRIIDVDAGQTCGKGESQVQWSKTGPAGPTGPQGPTGVVSTASFSGNTHTRPGPGGISDPLVFLGPTATVTTLADQRLTASASGSVDVTTDDTNVLIAICYASAPGGSVAPLGGDTTPLNMTLRGNGTHNLVSSSSSAAPGAGVWKVGLCGTAQVFAYALDSNDSVSGWVQVTN